MTKGETMSKRAKAASAAAATTLTTVRTTLGKVVQVDAAELVDLQRQRLVREIIETPAAASAALGSDATAPAAAEVEGGAE